MKDPHTQESRGFGFVKMVTAEQADAAKEGLQGENIEGRTLSIEKARRSRPRTPTPGKYFGPPKRGRLKTYCSCPVIFANMSQTMCAALLLGEVVATEATTAMMTAVAGVMAAAADMVEEDVMMTPTVLHATTTAAMDVVMITDQEASTATLPAAMTATAAVETIDVAGLTTIVVMADVAMAETLLLREIHTAEVGATMTVTIGTLVVRLRSANPPRYGALLEIMRPHLATRNGLRSGQHLDQVCGSQVLLLTDAGRMLP